MSLACLRATQLDIPETPFQGDILGAFSADALHHLNRLWRGSQQLYSKSLRNYWTSRPTSKGESNKHHTEKKIVSDACLHILVLMRLRESLIEVLYLRERLTPNPERGFHPFPSESYDLRFGSADSHLNHFTLVCELLQRQLKIASQQDHIICKKQRQRSSKPKQAETTKWDLLCPLATPRNSARKSNEQNQWLRAALTKSIQNESDFLFTILLFFTGLRPKCTYQSTNRN